MEARRRADRKRIRVTLRATMSTSTRLLICAASACLFAGCTRQTSDEEVAQPPAQTEKRAPEVDVMPGLDHGLLQSPVNIITGSAEDEPHEIAFNFHHAEASYLENKGTTVELDFPRGSTIVFDGKEYQLKQLHFHTPSEHQVDGVIFPMEMHVVNTIEPKTPDDLPQYLVLAFLYKMGDPDPIITSFLDQVPTEVGKEELKAGEVDLADYEGELNYNYYHYRGSLTTPPYTETVEWLVVQKIHEASPEQIRRLHGIEGDNARMVQPLYGRKVGD